MTPAEYIRRKKVYDVALTSEQVEAMSQQFREHAAWIVGQDEAYIIDSYYKAAAGIADGSLSPAEARRAVREALRASGYTPDDSEGWTDMQEGTARQKLILDTNIKKAAGYAWQQAIEGSKAFPAQELVRYGDRRVPRDWPTRWQAAWRELPPDERAKALPGPRMVALTDCAIWRAISRWRDPYPPFDYNSGMDVEPVPYEEAVQLGLLAEDAPVQDDAEAGEDDEPVTFGEAEHRMPQNTACPPDIIALLNFWIQAQQKGGAQ